MPEAPMETHGCQLPPCRRRETSKFRKWWPEGLRVPRDRRVGRETVGAGSCKGPTKRVSRPSVGTQWAVPWTASVPFSSYLSAPTPAEGAGTHRRALAGGQRHRPGGSLVEAAGSGQSAGRVRPRPPVPPPGQRGSRGRVVGFGLSGSSSGCSEEAAAQRPRDRRGGWAWLCLSPSTRCQHEGHQRLQGPAAHGETPWSFLGPQLRPPEPTASVSLQ